MVDPFLQNVETMVLFLKFLLEMDERAAVGNNARYTIIGRLDRDPKHRIFDLPNYIFSSSILFPQRISYSFSGNPTTWTKMSIASENELFSGVQERSMSSSSSRWQEYPASGDASVKERGSFSLPKKNVS